MAETSYGDPVARERENTRRARYHEELGKGASPKDAMRLANASVKPAKATRHQEPGAD